MTPDKPASAVGFFSDHAKEFRDMYRAQPEFHERLELWRGLLDRYAVADGFSVDMGCGPGIFSFYLAGKCRRVVAIDGASEMIALCEEQRRERGLENVEFSQGLLPNVDEAKLANADLLISSSVVEYVDDLDATLALFARALKPRGTLILSMPNLFSISRLQQRIKFRLTGDPEVYRHIKHFSSPRLLQRRVARLGLRCLEAHYYTHFTRLAKLARQAHLPRQLSEDLFVAVFRKS
jgi:2-polyprenyl-3-methyl-5-hydroxy-6-metoxy-1,4-benzoquinol methylase